MMTAQRTVAEAVRAEEQAWTRVAKLQAELAVAEADAKRCHAWTTGVQRLADKLAGVVPADRVIFGEAAVA